MHRLRLTIRDVITRSGGVRHAFLQRPSFKAKASAFVVISSDKSLCGAYNVNVVNLSVDQIRGSANPVVFAVGKHGEQMLRNKGVNIYKSYDTVSQAAPNKASILADELIDGYLDGVYDEVYICFTRYRNKIHQDPVCIRLFPLSADDFSDEIEDGNDYDMINGDMILSRLYGRYLKLS